MLEEEFKLDFEEERLSLRWEHTYGGTIACIPLIHGGIVYFGCDDYYVYAINAKTGEKVWQFKTGGCISNSSPAIADGMIIIGSYDG